MLYVLLFFQSSLTTPRWLSPAVVHSISLRSRTGWFQGVVFDALYKSVKNGTETRKSLEYNGCKTYRGDLERELKETNDQVIWRAGKTVRTLRPDAKPE